MDKKEYTYGDVLRAYYNYIDAQENLAMVYGDNIPRKQLDAYRCKQLDTMRDGIVDLLGDYYASNDTLLGVVADYIQHMQDDVISRRGF